MPVYLVTYDLRKEGQNYAGLYSAIEEYKQDKFPIMQSTLLIYDPKNSAVSIFDYLYQFLDKNDHIMVVELNDNHKAFLSDEAMAWLEDISMLPDWQ